MTYSTDDDIYDVLNDFEACRTGKDDFHHQQHLVVAICYLSSSGISDATQKLRNSLLRFLSHHKVDQGKYNETLTVFWLRMVERELKRLPEDLPLVDKCNSVVAELNNPRLVSEFYSDDLLSSKQARNRFMEPDLKLLFMEVQSASDTRSSS